MKTILFSLIIVATVCTVAAQDHLEPEPGLLADQDKYQAILREVFADAYKGEVVLLAYINVSFQPEEVVGIRRKGTGYEAFAIMPSASVWETEYHTFLKGPFDKNGKLILMPGEAERRKKLPRSYHEITTTTKSASISAALVERTKRVWEKMLLDARHEKDPPIVLDGASYHFSMWIRGHGIISAKAHPIGGRSNVSAMADIADTLSKYAKRAVNENEFSKEVKYLE